MAGLSLLLFVRSLFAAEQQLTRLVGWLLGCCLLGYQYAQSSVGAEESLHHTVETLSVVVLPIASVRLLLSVEPLNILLS
jgi:hypothetical protein